MFIDLHNFLPEQNNFEGAGTQNKQLYKSHFGTNQLVDGVLSGVYNKNTSTSQLNGGVQLFQVYTHSF